MASAPDRAVLTGRWRGALLALATAGALVPRVVNLGALSFHADEDTSAFPARAMAEGGAPRFPSGMAYHREILATALYAASARVLGTEREAAYRLPVAVLGTLTVPIVYFAASAIVSPTAAAAAAAMLAVSEWHLVFSRQVRTYVPLLLAVVLAAAALQRWIERDRRRDLVLAGAAVAVAVTLHQVGVLVTAFVWLPYAFPGYPRVSVRKASVFGLGAIAAALLWREAVVQPPYRIWSVPPPPWVMGIVVGESSPLPGALAMAPGVALVTGLAGAILGGWIGARGFPPVPVMARVLRIGAGVLMGAAAGAGQIYGALVCGTALLMMAPGRRVEIVRRAALPLGALALVASAWGLLAVSRLGVYPGLRSLAAIPYPMPFLLGHSMPGLMVLFALACAWAALVPPEPNTARLRVLLLATLALVAAPTVLGGWPPSRYVFHAYAFMLIGAAAALVSLVAALTATPRLARLRPTLVFAIIASGALGAHGVPQAWRVTTLRPGEPVDELLHMVAFRPDYRGAGGFVRQAMQAGDVVIAEEPLSTLWYAGAADYLLRGYLAARPYVHRSPDGYLAHNYAGSRLLHDRRSVEAVLAGSVRVWLVTSGEVHPHASTVLAGDQLAWLDSVVSRAAPAFTGADGWTRVYCLNCPGAAGNSASPVPAGRR